MESSMASYDSTAKVDKFVLQVTHRVEGILGVQADEIGLAEIALLSDPDC
jgi:hypothetical protein